MKIPYQKYILLYVYILMLILKHNLIIKLDTALLQILTRRFLCCMTIRPRGCQITVTHCNTHRADITPILNTQGTECMPQPMR